MYLQAVFPEKRGCSFFKAVLQNIIRELCGKKPSAKSSTDSLVHATCAPKYSPRLASDVNIKLILYFLQPISLVHATCAPKYSPRLVSDVNIKRTLYIPAQQSGTPVPSFASCVIPTSAARFLPTFQPSYYCCSARYRNIPHIHSICK